MTANPRTAIVSPMSPVPASSDVAADPHLASLEAEHRAEEKWSLAGRLVSMAAGTAGIGALVGPEGAVVGAALGSALAIVLAARDRPH
jgi:hypothetical protein